MIPLPLAALSFSAALLVQEPAHAPAPEKESAAEKKAAPEKEAAAEDEKQKEKRFEEREVATEHVLRAGGAELRYRAAAGTLNLEQEDGAERASIFYVAYSLTGDGGQAPEASARPISFCFNGGPGSSSVWLHLGVLGPKRVVLEEGGAPLPPPFRLEDNAHSLLPATDLVFIDPVTTGYSRALPGEDAGQFHGVTEDVEAVGEFVRLWTTRNRRWSSPKFLMGESYGTTRAAALAGHLQDRLGMYLNGIVLVSPILDFRTARFDPGNDLPYVLFLPTYAATAWYHRALDPALQADLGRLLAEAETFATGEYAQALLRGDALGEVQRREIAAKLARYTGLSSEFALQCNLRVGIQRFCKELLRAKRRSVGRLDSRFLGLDADAAGEEYDYDPSYAAIQGPFTAALNHYVRAELGYESDLPYEILSGRVQPWKFGPAENRYLNVGETLRGAMSKNPHLKVFAACGYYDLATPYFAAQHTLEHLGLEPERRANVSMGFYEAGHMMYVHAPSLERFERDVSAFVKSATGH